MKTYVVFVHSENIEAGTATVAIKRYAKSHPDVNIKHIRAVNLIAVRSAKDDIIGDALVSSGAITPEQKAKVEAI